MLSKELQSMNRSSLKRSQRAYNEIHAAFCFLHIVEYIVRFYSVVEMWIRSFEMRSVNTPMYIFFGHLVVPDLVLLDDMCPPLILHNLRKRFEKQQIYVMPEAHRLFFCPLLLSPAFHSLVLSHDLHLLPI